MGPADAVLAGGTHSNCPRMRVWQERERRDPPCRIAEPAAQRPTVIRQRGAQNGRVSGNPAPIRRRVAHHHPRGDVTHSPASIGGEPGCQATVSIHRGEQLLDVHELRLQFNHEQLPAPRVERQDVDHSPLAVHREGDLGDGDPRGVATKESRHLLMHLAVARSKHPVEVSATPARDKIDLDLKSCRHGQQGVERKRSKVASL